MQPDTPTINRRELIKRSAAASVGAAITFMENNSIKAEPLFTGLAAEYDQYDGLGLAELIAKRHVTPLELLGAVRQRVEALNPRLNAFCALFFERAEAQLKNGLSDGPFKGVPFALKDLGVHLSGVPTTFGSRVYKNYVPDLDSTLVERYKRAGLVIFGKTATPEFGLTTTTESVLFGLTHNPWNLERTSGGSSGGASAAVSSRVLPMAHGSDGGGSIRIPASCCGLFGLKPTRGRVPLGPTQFESWNGCSHHHALTISVRDSAALLDATAGAELGSPFFVTPPARPFLQEVGADPGKLRVALVVEPTNGSTLDPECRKAVLEAAKLCESLGHKVEEAKLPVDDAPTRAAFMSVLQVSLARTLDDAAKPLGRAVTEKDVEPITWVIGQAGKNISSVVYSRAIATLHQVGLALAKFMQRYDVILQPTLGQPPVALGTLSLSRDDLQGYIKDVGAFSPNTALYNMSGQPSASVPLHWTAQGLPVGVMFTTRFGEDATLIRLAAQLEKAKPWAGRRPKF
jgi:amidase/6-aminohexanoate-cyclic-dimer hydrolase